MPGLYRVRHWTDGSAQSRGHGEGRGMRSTPSESLTAARKVASRVKCSWLDYTERAVGLTAAREAEAREREEACM